MSNPTKLGGFGGGEAACLYSFQFACSPLALSLSRRLKNILATSIHISLHSAEAFFFVDSRQPVKFITNKNVASIDSPTGYLMNFSLAIETLLSAIQ